MKKMNVRLTAVCALIYFTIPLFPKNIVCDIFVLIASFMFAYGLANPKLEAA